MKKNILFLVADDQRFDTIAALGHPAIQTPNFDWLVENHRSSIATTNANACPSHGRSKFFARTNFLAHARRKKGK
ncbi:hypothetical protein [Enterococcus lemanii]|uniref:Sulfatase N-terminal domain-containing protein n=1 Tax=Enterococcus lemanii TaxID=1159752 RepID=A0ABV9MVT4_9ENTE|nr:hypothetical protein [Enterococcus lemanii]MBM7709003.1 arylsulfatase A-like enzyme [Enterococcus lemanii]